MKSTKGNRGSSNLKKRVIIDICLLFLVIVVVIFMRRYHPAPITKPEQIAPSIKSAASDTNRPVSPSVAGILLLINSPSFAPQNTDPKVPFIQHDICPFECCQFGKWTARSPLKVFKEEGDDSSVLFTIQPGEDFTAISGNLHIIKLGIIIIDRSFSNYKKGERVYVLSYRGEGEYDLWHNGKKLDSTDDVWKHGTLKRSPEFIWWVSITSKNGQQGWLRFKNISDNGFQTEEKVDGRDSCS